MIKSYWKNDYGKLYNGDCRFILPFIEKIDLVVTSPPYDDFRLYDDLEWNWSVFTTIANMLLMVLKPGGIVVWVTADRTDKDRFKGESGTSLRQALFFKEIGFNLHDTMIWRKNQVRFPEKPVRYNQGFEYMFVLSKGEPKTFNAICDRKNITYIDHEEGKTRKLVHTVWRKDHMDKDETSKIKNIGYHEPRPYGKRMNVWTFTVDGVTGREWKFPAAFPKKLARDHIVSWSNKGDVVLDPMAGSGTVPLIAQSLGRKWIAIDTVEKYCKTIVKRMTGQRTRTIKRRTPNKKYYADKKHKMRRLFKKWEK